MRGIPVSFTRTNKVINTPRRTTALVSICIKITIITTNGIYCNYKHIQIRKKTRVEDCTG